MPNHAQVMCLNVADHVIDHALYTWLSCTDDVPQEAIIKELSTHKSRIQQAIIMDITCDESCCSAGKSQADEQVGITRLSWQLSSR